MKRLSFNNLKVVASSLVLALSFTASAKDVAPKAGEHPLTAAEQKALEGIKHPVKPMLWKVEKEGLSKANWLFGTIHMADPRVTNMHPAAEKAYADAHRIYTEVDMSIGGQLKAAPLMMRKDNKTMSESIGKELTAKIDAELRAVSPMFNMKVFNPMKTWVMVVTLPQIKEQVGGKKPLDFQLWERAVKEEKSALPLETHEEQTRGLNALTEAEQVGLLKATVEQMQKARKEKKDPIKPLLDLYLTGDSQKISEFLEKEFNNDQMPKELRDKFIKGLLHERNKRMADNIHMNLIQHPNKSHFFAVGAAHYLNDKSVCEFLEKKGYKITRVHK